MSSSDLLDVFDRHIASTAAPAYAAHSALSLPAPMQPTAHERRAALGPYGVCGITPEAERYLATRREARDAAREAVVVAYRADKKPRAWDRRLEALARLTATVPDRAAAEEQATRAAAIAADEVWAAVMAQLQALYPD